MNPINNSGNLLIYKFNGYFSDNYNHFDNNNVIENDINNSVDIKNVDKNTSYVVIGQILCKKTDTYRFLLNSSDSSILAISEAGTFIDYDKVKNGIFNSNNILKNLSNNYFVNENIVVDNRGIHDKTSKSGAIMLSKDIVYDIIILYGNNLGIGSLLMTLKTDKWNTNLNNHNNNLEFAPYINIPMNKQQKQFQGLKNDYENYNSQLKNIDDNAEKSIKILSDKIDIAIDDVNRKNNQLDEALKKQYKIIENIKDNYSTANNYTNYTSKLSDKANNIQKTINNGLKSVNNDIDKLYDGAVIYEGTNNTSDAIPLENFTNLFSNIIEGNDNLFTSAKYKCNSPERDEYLCTIAQRINKKINDSNSNDRDIKILKRAQNELTEIMSQNRNVLSDIVYNYIMNEDLSNNTLTSTVEDIKDDNKFKQRKLNIYNNKINKNKDYLKLLKVLTVFAVIIMFLIIIRINELIPENINLMLIIFVITLAVVYTIYILYNINIKDKYDYSKINHTGDVLTQRMLTSGKLERKDNLLSRTGLMECVGDECCTNNMSYDSELNRCISNVDSNVDSNVAGFRNINIDPFRYFTEKYNKTDLNNENKVNFRQNKTISSINYTML